jgi:hypothetical protein
VVGKSEGTRRLGTLNHRWDDDIKMYLKEIECWGADLINLAYNGYHWEGGRGCCGTW